MVLGCWGPPDMCTSPLPCCPLTSSGDQGGRLAHATLGRWGKGVLGGNRAASRSQGWARSVRAQTPPGAANPRQVEMKSGPHTPPSAHVRKGGCWNRSHMAQIPGFQETSGNKTSPPSYSHG